MGKVYKNKRRSCALCKPHKRKWAKRFKPRERKLRAEVPERILDES